ncbi:MAG: molecular chaperone HtpG [bacterium]
MVPGRLRPDNPSPRERRPSVGVETFTFKSEARQLLDLMIHSLYSNKEIFLRELISNASDALDKLRFEALTQADLLPEATTLRVRVAADEAARTLTVEDTGIGMSRDEVVENLGTIARSGTKEFAARMSEARKAEGTDAESLIGQFGVGFYSAFMVAEEVTVVTRRAGSDAAWIWHSTGDGTFTLTEGHRDQPGTTVKLKLRAADPENGLPDFTKGWTLRRIIKKYSDFVQYPIELRQERTEVERDEEGEPVAGAEEKTVVEWQTVNSMKAIWTRNPDDVTAEEYAEFYKHISHDWEAPFETMTLKAEGTFEYRALLFVPERAPFDLFYRDQKYGLQLYVNRVLIMENCQDLVPDWLRFLRGVVDSPDLSLNVSREILQQDRHVKAIRKRLVKKVLDTFAKLQAEDADRYLTIWNTYGRVLKEGSTDADFRDRLKGLYLFASSAGDALTTLDGYVERMKEGQDAIYYLTGESRAAVERSPHLEAFKAKGYEVLYLTEPVDEILVGHITSFKDHKLQSVGKGTVELGTEEERQAAEKAREEKTAENKDLLEQLQSTLDAWVKEVRLSTRLTTSAACLVGEEHDMSPGLERMFAQAQADVDRPRQKRILELNPDHALLGKLKVIYEENREDARLASYAKLLHGQALLAEGSSLPDPVEFGRLVADLMVRA